MPTYTLIASNTLSSSAASVTFSSIPSTYSDLVVKISSRSDILSSNANFFMYLNGDSSTTNKSYTMVRGYATIADSIRASSQSTLFLGIIPADSATTNSFSNDEIYIPNYTSSVSKPISSFVIYETNAANGRVQSSADLIGLTSAVTSITFTNSSNFVSGSSFYLYGIKNS